MGTTILFVFQFFCFCLGIFDSTYVEECLFGYIVYFAVHNHIETLDSVFDRHHNTGYTREGFCHVERLRQETLYAASTVYDKLVVVRELFHTEYGDDVLQLFVTLQ